MIRIAAAISFALVALTPSSYAEVGFKPVLELFSSQGCGNCPKANDIFADYAGRNDVVGLTYAVGYWDYLGWADTFAKPEFTERQKAYNDTLGRRGPYTPQMVFNGTEHCSGAKPKSVAKKFDRLAPPNSAAVIEYDGHNAWIRGETDTPLDIWLVTYEPGETIAIPESGRNKGVEMRHQNLVTSLTDLGSWGGDETIVHAPCDGACVILVQEDNMGPIVGVARYETQDLSALD